MPPIETPDVSDRERTDRDSDWIPPFKVVVHNCDCHTFEEVTLALMKTLSMSAQSAHEFATLVHLIGAAVVYEGERERCELIAENIIAWAGLSIKTGLPLNVTVET